MDGNNSGSRHIAATVVFGQGVEIDAARVTIGDNARLGDSVDIQADEVAIGEDCVIDGGFRFRGGALVLAPRAQIGSAVSIDADHFSLGHKSVIEENCRFAGIRSRARKVVIGDFSTIAYESRFLVPEFRIGDYCVLFNHLLVNGYELCSMGHNCYVGQHTVLNASEKLIIGNNVRLALNCYIWTHVESGELLEGCTMYGRRPVVIEDDVWLTGCNISISPGVTLGRGSIILHGSVVSKSTEPRRCYSGVPAKDVTEKIRPYRDVTLDEKFEMMKGFVAEFCEKNADANKHILVREHFPARLPPGRPLLVVARDGVPRDYGAGVSSFSLETKEYIKRRTPLEEAFIRFHVGCRARFLPLPLGG